MNSIIRSLLLKLITGRRGMIACAKRWRVLFKFQFLFLVEQKLDHGWLHERAQLSLQKETNNVKYYAHLLFYEK